MSESNTETMMIECPNENCDFDGEVPGWWEDMKAECRNCGEKFRIPLKTEQTAS